MPVQYASDVIVTIADVRGVRVAGRAVFDVSDVTARAVCDVNDMTRGALCDVSDVTVAGVRAVREAGLVVCDVRVTWQGKQYVTSE